MSNWADFFTSINLKDDPSAVLDKLAFHNVASFSTMAIKDLNGQELPPEVFDFLRSVFALAAELVRSNREHDFLDELILLAGELGATGILISEAFDFLQSVLEHQSKNKYASIQATQAVDSLLRCINSQKSDLAEAALISFAFTIAIIPKPQRESLLKAAKKFPQLLKKSSLLNGLTLYHERLIRIEKAIESSWTVKDAFSLITIHSHKGGVGKTTLAIALARALSDRGRRVCIVDCDDEGPSLHFYVNVDKTKQKNALFFCDWFCSESSTLQEGLVLPVDDIANVSIIPGSFLGTDLTRIDQQVLQLRKRSNDSSLVEGRMVLLIELLHKKGFDSVILDTSPGMDRLSLEVLMASISVAGSKVFVLRPRPADIALLCFEDDWIHGQSKLGGAYSVVLNFSFEDDSLNVDDTEAIVTELIRWPQFVAYANRFSTNDISDEIKTMVQMNWPKFRHEKMHFTNKLARAWNLGAKTTLNAIGNETMSDADRILNNLLSGYIYRNGS